MLNAQIKNTGKGDCVFPSSYAESMKIFAAYSKT